jgi:hypothetical protein
MVFYDFQCQRCGWDMERLVSRYVIEVKCPMCGYMSQNRWQSPKGELKSQYLVNKQSTNHRKHPPIDTMFT